jgi:hypothetical protein
MVQGAHAVAQHMLDFPDSKWNNQTLVFCLVRNEEHLKYFELKLQSTGKSYSKFCEPDIGNQLTSISCFDDGKIFSRLKLA